MFITLLKTSPNKLELALKYTTVCVMIIRIKGMIMHITTQVS